MSLLILPTGVQDPAGACGIGSPSTYGCQVSHWHQQPSKNISNSTLSPCE